MPKAIRFQQLGGPEVLKIEDVPTRTPGEGEVLLKVAAVGLNRAESMYFHGQYMEKPQLPSGLGYEVAGTVLAVGPGVDPSLVGKQFATIPGYSQNKYPSLAEEAVVPAKNLAAVPDTLSPTEAAAVWMQYGTAWAGLVTSGKLQRGQTVLITAAASSVGLAAIQIARDLGATSIATTRQAGKKQQLLDLGADHVIVTTEEDVPARMREITGGKGVNLIYDPIGGDITPLALGAAPRATYVLYGMLSGQPTPYPLAVFGTGFMMTASSISTDMNTDELRETAKSYIIERLKNGTFKPHIARTFPFAQTVEAYQFLESNEQVGKVIITL